MHDLHLAGWYTERWFVCIVVSGFVLLPLSWLPSMKPLGFTSLASVICVLSFVCFAVVTAIIQIGIRVVAPCLYLSPPRQTQAQTNTQHRTLDVLYSSAPGHVSCACGQVRVQVHGRLVAGLAAVRSSPLLCLRSPPEHSTAVRRPHTVITIPSNTQHTVVNSNSHRCWLACLPPPPCVYFAHGSYRELRHRTR